MAPVGVGVGQVRQVGQCSTGGTLSLGADLVRVSRMMRPNLNSMLSTPVDVADSQVNGG